MWTYTSDKLKRDKHYFLKGKQKLLDFFHFCFIIPYSAYKPEIKGQSRWLTHKDCLAVVLEPKLGEYSCLMSHGLSSFPHSRIYIFFHDYTEQPLFVLTYTKTAGNLKFAQETSFSWVKNVLRPYFYRADIFNYMSKHNPLHYMG